MAERYKAAPQPKMPEQYDSSNLLLMGEKNSEHKNVIGQHRRRIEQLILVISWAPLGQSAPFI